MFFDLPVAFGTADFILMMGVSQAGYASRKEMHLIQA